MAQPGRVAADRDWRPGTRRLNAADVGGGDDPSELALVQGLGVIRAGVMIPYS